MCYICEARGHVGKNYKAAQKEINAALAVWSRVRGAPKRRADWTTAPTKRLWSNADMRAYAKTVTP